MEENKQPIADLGVKTVPASEAINGGGHPEATAKPFVNYPRNEELIVQAVINSEADGYALLRALQIIVNSFGGDTIVKLVDKLEKNPNLAVKAKQYIPIVLMM